MANSKVCFIRNNVKGLQLSKKQLKLTGYQKNKIESNGVLFLPETNSVSDYENDWADDLKVQVFFCMIHPTLWDLIFSMIQIYMLKEVPLI